VEGDILDKNTFAAVEGGVGKGHCSVETVVDEILLAMGPLEFEVVHGWPASGKILGVVSMVWDAGVLEIGGGGDGAEWLGGMEGFEGGGDLLGDVKDGFYAALDETFPVAGMVLRAEPDAGNDLDGSVRVGGGFVAVLVLAIWE